MALTSKESKYLERYKYGNRKIRKEIAKKVESGKRLSTFEKQILSNNLANGVTSIASLKGNKGKRSKAKNRYERKAEMYRNMIETERLKRSAQGSSYKGNFQQVEKDLRYMSSVQYKMAGSNHFTSQRREVIEEAKKRLDRLYRNGVIDKDEYKSQVKQIYGSP